MIKQFDNEAFKSSLNQAFKLSKFLMNIQFIIKTLAKEIGNFIKNCILLNLFQRF